MNKQSFITILLAVLMSMTGAKTFAHDIEVANDDDVTIYYIWTNNNTELAVSYRGSSYSYYSNEYSGNVVIPESVVYDGNTYSVTSIGDDAFYSCSFLTSIEIPNSVTSIGYRAFYNCSDLTSITIPNSVTSIGYRAFYNCGGLTSVTIPNNVTDIGEQVFYGCSGLTSVTIPNSVTYIGYQAFGYCSGLTSVVIGSSVTRIHNGAFSGTNLKKIIWLTNTPPSGYSDVSGAVNYVSNDQFSSLSNTVIYRFLSSYFDVDGVRYVPVSPSEKTCDAIDCMYDESAADMKIASMVTYKGVTMTVKSIKPYLAYNNMYINTLSVDIDGNLPEYAFTGCSNLKTIIYGDHINGLGDLTFSNCSSLTSLISTENVLYSNILYISKNINTIGNYTFDGCKEIKNVIIADSDTELTLGSNVSSHIFSSCPLETVYIGRNINYNTSSSSGYSPFYRNTSLKTVSITDKETEISDNEFYGCTNLQSITIGDGVTTIGKYAFSGCSSLKYFTFGSQVQTIGEEAFSDCSAMVEIISKAQNPPVCGSQALDDINKFECKLYVPDGYKAVYEGADQWMDFFFKEEGEGTGGQGGGVNYGKCETPTITIDGGIVKFGCNTNGVIFHYSISSSDIKNDITDSNVNLTKSYTISVYATKEGYENSEVATRDIEFSSVSSLPGDVDGNGIVNVADHVKLTEIIMSEGE